jgi:hypothetical protein
MTGETASRRARHLLWLLAACALTLLLPALPVPALQLATAPLPLLLLLWAAVLALLLTREGRDRLPRLALALLAAYLAGGIVCDVVVALAVYPAFQGRAIFVREAVANGLGDPAIALPLATGLALGVQALVQVTTGLLCTAFLAHRHALLEEAGRSAAGSRWQFLKAATGGARLTWRQWLVPLRWRDLPEPLPVLWLVGALLLGFGFLPWFGGLVHQGVVSRELWPGLMLLILAIPLGLYCLWLWRRAPR